MLNELRDEIHVNAIAHGWWDEERSFGEIIALCHSELSEALEEYRNDSDLLYCTELSNCKNVDNNCAMCFRMDIAKENGIKPEGIAIELADTIIRILDYCGHANIDIDAIIANRRIENKTYSLPDLIDECHYALSMAYKGREVKEHCFAECIALIQFWCSENNIDIDEAIRIKHEYNKTRPWRHNGKIL